MPDFLRFGIPSLDKLIGSHGEGDYGIDLRAIDGDRKEEVATGICLMGPDGTGKSVFALHLASRYLADCLVEEKGNGEKRLPQILYFSTDLTYKKALKTWEHFALDRPFHRTIPVERVKYPSTFDEELVKSTKIELGSYTSQNVVKYLEQEQDVTKTKQYEICFLDLASTTAGDDWGFVHRLLALMQQPPEDDPRHLVIVDAVEGFETYVGQLDAFGEESSRRARIAQLARLASAKAHTLLIVEEMRSMQRLPEEFVTDIVIRLRNVEAKNYLRRTVEIEKTRGQSHTRGQHPFSIRKGKGSTTGSQDNVDDPEILGERTDYPYQDYVQIFPSLNYVNRSVMELTHAPRGSQAPDEYAAFGIPYLDNMLGGEGFEAESKLEPESGSVHDTRGLPCGSVTALIGDSLTQKTRLGRSFLSRCFFPFKKSDSFEQVARTLLLKNKTELDEIKKLEEKRENSQVPLEREDHRELARLKNVIATTEDAQAQDLLQRCGVAVLFTTLDTHHEALVNEFLDTLSIGLLDKDKRLIAEILIESRTICRRMEIHDVPASVLAHIFEQNLREAQNILKLTTSSSPSERFRTSKRIRVVFDDFNVFRNTYHEVREDPLFLPYLLFFLGREGVTALIVDTQSISRPDLTLTERYESELRELVQYRLYTWRVPFYGDNRVAITAIPPFSPSTSGAIRELRWEDREDRTQEDRAGSSRVSRPLEVNPHFELYTGLEEGKLQPVPIEIRFYAENQAFKRYLEEEGVTFSELFVPYKREGQAESGKVFYYYGPEDYHTMRDFCSLQRGTRLDHTLVFQVDEFWTVRPPKSGRTGAFHPLWDYLNATTWNKKSNPQREAGADLYGIFQPTKKEAKEKETFRRLDFYDQKNVPYAKDYGEDPLKLSLDRVPFSWDFGFLLCNERAWVDAASEDIFRERAQAERVFLNKLWGKKIGSPPVKVADLWDSLTKATPQKNDPSFRIDEHVDLTGLAMEFRDKEKPISQYLWVRLSDSARQCLPDVSGSLSELQQEVLIQDLNRLVEDPSLFDAFAQASEETKNLIAKHPKGKHLNRLLLQEAYPRQMRPIISWFEFFAACKRVAEHQSYKISSTAQAFDVSVFGPETLPCLVIEIWASEILAERAKDNRYAIEVSPFVKELSQRKLERSRYTSLLGGLGHLGGVLKDENKPLSCMLRDRLKRKKDKGVKIGQSYSLELYKTWLLLTEAIDFSVLVTTPDAFSLEFSPRPVSSSVVAARHWYKTACQFVESLAERELEANWTPVRLPGHFSIRGDWFLTVAGGSRSTRLADRALDMLGSKRANIDRLHEGSGLPVRKLFNDTDKDCHLRTRLITSDGKQLTNLPYGDLLKIGENPKEGFHWLWRSNIDGYYRELRIWHRWLSQMIVWWHSVRLKYTSSWTNGFEIYARLETIMRDEEQGEKLDESIRQLELLDSWSQFHTKIDILIDSLKQVSSEEEGREKTKKQEKLVPNEEEEQVSSESD